MVNSNSGLFLKFLSNGKVCVSDGMCRVWRGYVDQIRANLALYQNQYPPYQPYGGSYESSEQYQGSYESYPKCPAARLKIFS